MISNKRVRVVKGTTNYRVAIDHQSRRQLIDDMPTIRIRRIMPKTWGGLFIADALPREGRRVHKHLPWDEELTTSSYSRKD